MSVSELLDRLPGRSSRGVERREFECAQCGTTFDSAKRPERAQCMECLSSDVEVVGTVTRG